MKRYEIKNSFLIAELGVALAVVGAILFSIYKQVERV